jgi:hypothetical protein
MPQCGAKGVDLRGVVPNFPKNYTYAMQGSWISKDLRISRCALVTSVRI